MRCMELEIEWHAFLARILSRPATLIGYASVSFVWVKTQVMVRSKVCASTGGACSLNR